jgi:hypothetical protein
VRDQITQISRLVYRKYRGHREYITCATKCGRCPVSDLGALVRMVAERTQADNEDAFLGTFAEAVGIDELPAGAEPTSVLFDWGGIIETDTLELHRKPATGKLLGKQVSKRILHRLLGHIVPLFPDDEAWQFGPVPTSPRGRIGLTSNKYSVKTILGGHTHVALTGTLGRHGGAPQRGDGIVAIDVLDVTNEQDQGFTVIGIHCPDLGPGRHGQQMGDQLVDLHRGRPLLAMLSVRRFRSQ